MVQIVKEIQIDVARENTYKATVYAKQFDRLTRYIVAHLTEEGSVIKVASDTFVTFVVKRSDGEVKAFKATVLPDGSVQLPLNYWVLYVEGEAECEVAIFDDGGAVSKSFTFYLIVEQSLLTGDEIIDDDNYGLLIELIENVKSFETEITTLYGKLATASAEWEEAETAREEASATAVANAETATANAETATTAAQEATTAAETATANAETATANAETATTAAQEATTAANEATANTNTAITNAETATANANAAAASVDTAIANAEIATEAANTATNNANTATTNANNATTAANEATEAANSAAASAAEAAKEMSIYDEDEDIYYTYAYTVENGHLVINLTKVDSE